MASLGTYCNGDPFIVNPAGGAGVRVASVSPAKETEGNGRQKNGVMLNYGAPGSSLQGFDSIGPGDNFYGVLTNYDPANNQFVGYDPARNVSIPAEFAAGVEGTLLKAVSTPVPTLDYNRNRLQFVGLMTVCAAEPPAGAFRPAVAAPSKISHWVEDDVDWGKLRNLTLIAGVPTPATVLAGERWPLQAWMTTNAVGRSVSPDLNTPTAGTGYGSDIARNAGSALLLMNLAIDAGMKRDLTVAMVQRGIDVFERVKNGGSFYNGGGGHSCRKTYLVTAAHLLGDAEMQEWCDRSLHKVFVEDDQYELVNAYDVANRGYDAAMLGTPEWKILGNNHASENPSTGASYRTVNLRWQIGVALGMMLMGAKTVWANDIFFNYADRIMERSYFPSSGTEKWATTQTGTNSPPAFHKAMWAAYRAAAGMPAVWNWS